MTSVTTDAHVLDWLGYETENSQVYREFRNKVSQALIVVTTQSRYAPLVQRFRQSFECRAAFPWTAESEKRPGQQIGGLTDVLRRTLGGYIPEAALNGSENSSYGMPTANGSGRTLTDDWVSRMKAAALAAAADEFYITAFARALYRAGFDVARIPDFQLEEQVARSLQAYAQSCESAESSDPW